MRGTIGLRLSLWYSAVFVGSTNSSNSKTRWYNAQALSRSATYSYVSSTQLVRGRDTAITLSLPAD